MTKNTRRNVSRSPRNIGVFTAIVRCFPYIFTGAVMGFVMYNPTGWSLYHFGVQIFMDPGDGTTPFYLQLPKILLAIVVVSLAGLIYFKWEIARDETRFLAVFGILWGLANLLVLGIFFQFTGENPFSLGWLEWQAMPFFMSGLAFGATLPRIRRAYSHAFTAGGGSFDSYDESDESHV